MPRCGCASGAQVLMQGDDPVVVTGDGTPGARFTISISHGGRQGCAGITACVGDYLGAGLAYSSATGQIAVRVSSDAGNAIGFGSDNGLFSTGEGGGGGGSTCAQKTVASLEALPAGSLVWGAYRFGGLINGFPSLEAVDHLLNHNIDIIHANVCASADQVACLSIAGDARTVPGLSTVHAITDLRDVTADEWKRLTCMLGDDFNPRSNRWDGSPVEGYGGGWWGWKAKAVRHATLRELLDRVAGRAVVLADCRSEGAFSSEVDNIAAALRAVQATCRQSQVLIGINDTANAATVQAAGCTPILVSGGNYWWQSTTIPWTVEQVQTAGVTWIATQRNMQDATHQLYQSNGINTLIMWGDRHIDRTRAEGLGVRGVLSHDPVYMRGPVAREYRTNLDPFRVRTVGPGVLSHLTSDGRELSRVVDTPSGGVVRGQGDLTDGGIWLPPGWGGAFGRPSVLMGWSCPLRNPTTYTIEFQMRFPTQASYGSLGKAGLLFGAPDDDYTYHYPDDTTLNPRRYPEGKRQYYRVWQRVNGMLGIGVFKPGTGTFYYLNGSTESEDNTGMEVSSPVPATAVWNTYQLQVTPTTISWRRTLSSGTQYTVTASNTDWRGPYWYVEKEEAFAGFDEQFNPGRQFTAAFRNFTVTSV